MRGAPPSRAAPPSEAPRGDVPGDVAGGERRDHRLLKRAVLPAILSELVLVFRADVDLGHAVAVEIGEADGVLEARRLGIDQRLLPAGAVLLEEPESGGERAGDEVDLAVAVHVAGGDGAHLPIGNRGDL